MPLGIGIGIGLPIGEGVRGPPTGTAGQPIGLLLILTKAA